MEELIVRRDGLRIYGQAAFPEGEGPWPLVVFSHGFGAARVYESGMEQDFLARDMAFAAFDFCGGGPLSRSDGSMLDMSVLTEAADLNVVMDALRADARVDAGRLFLMGTSQGGWVSSYVAAERPEDVAGLVLFFPAFVIADDARRRLEALGGIMPDEVQVGPHTVGKRYHEDALSVDIYERLGGYRGDVLIVHGAQDEVVPVEYSRRAQPAFGGACRLEVIEGLGHGFRAYPPEYHQRAMALALEFLEERR